MNSIRTDHDTIMPCGDRIRHLRQRQRLTLQVLADRAGISVGFLSQVERSRATPSLATLADLAASLGESIDYFTATPKPQDVVTRAAKRERVCVGTHALSYEKLSTDQPGGVMTSLIIHVPPKFKTETLSRGSEEMVLVLEGEVVLKLGEAPLTLATGDSLHFMGESPHSLENPGDTPARLIWVGTASPFSACATSQLVNDPQVITDLAG